MHGPLSLLCAFTLVGCTSTVGAPERVAGLARFMALPAPEILSYPRTLTVDESLIAMRQDGIVSPLVDEFDSAGEVLALLGRIRGTAPALRNGVPELVGSAVANDGSESAEIPVFFVWPTWKVSYQRFPPRLDHVRLELGVIAKVIPRGQVMERRGQLALRTATWEARCHLYASGGTYLSISEWLADDWARWREALAEVREVCGRQIGDLFEQSATALDYRAR